MYVFANDWEGFAAVTMRYGMPHGSNLGGDYVNGKIPNSDMIERGREDDGGVVRSP